MVKFKPNINPNSSSVEARSLKKLEVIDQSSYKPINLIDKSLLSQTEQRPGRDRPSNFKLRINELNKEYLDYRENTKTYEKTMLNQMLNYGGDDVSILKNHKVVAPGEISFRSKANSTDTSTRKIIN